jgi:hypothetical protein
MKHEKTFEAINKLKDIELELHRLKNALEMANKALDKQRTWVGSGDVRLVPLTDEQIEQAWQSVHSPSYTQLKIDIARAIEAAHGIGDKT